MEWRRGSVWSLVIAIRKAWDRTVWTPCGLASWATHLVDDEFVVDVDGYFHLSGVPRRQLPSVDHRVQRDAHLRKRGTQHTVLVAERRRPSRRLLHPVEHHVRCLGCRLEYLFVVNRDILCLAGDQLPLRGYGSHALVGDLRGRGALSLCQDHPSGHLPEPSLVFDCPELPQLSALVGQFDKGDLEEGFDSGRSGRR